MKAFLFKLFCFPWWLARRFRWQAELDSEMQKRIGVLEDFVHNELTLFRSDVNRRLQTVEDEIRSYLHFNVEDLRRRMQTIEDDFRDKSPEIAMTLDDLRRRMQTLEDDFRTSSPDVQRRLLVLEDVIRTRVLCGPVYRDVSARKLPADCSCRHVLGRETAPGGKPRILVDVSQLLITNGRSGIQRVVIRVLDAMLEDSRCRYVPVGLCAGEMYYVEYHQEEGAFYIGELLRVMKNDTLFMLDSSWEFCDLFAKTYAQIRAADGKIYFGVYDLIPLLQSQYATAVMTRVFGEWLGDAVMNADGMLCDSRTVAEQLQQYIMDHNMPHRVSPLKIGHFVVGADFIETSDCEATPELTRVFERVKGKKKFLSVSTLEPRKNHKFMLDVMDKLWERGYDVVYFIVGKQGWNTEDVVERIQNHPELDKRLFWFKFLEDCDLKQVYEESDILLNLSYGEGYGLPLVEGAHYQCAVVASDIPVFHEVITDDTTLFCNIGSLEETVDAIAAKLDADGFVPSATQYYRWSDALSSMLRCMREGKWDFEVK